MGTFYKPGDVLSPSGWVKIDNTCRRGEIDNKKRKIGFCTWCGKETVKPKRFWCSKDCFEIYDKTQHSTLKKVVKKRDKTICSLCGIRCGSKDKWDLDHKIPIVEGGHPFDLNNLRTLCKSCHKNETKILMKRLAQNRKK